MAPDPAVQAMLDRRIQSTVHIPRTAYIEETAEQTAGWESRMWDLYAAAARVAGRRAPTSADKRRFFGD